MINSFEDHMKLSVLPCDQRSGLKWHSKIRLVARSVQAQFEHVCWQAGLGRQGGGLLLEAHQKHRDKIGDQTYPTIWRHTMFIYQSAVHVTPCERGWAAGVRYVACRTGRKDAMFGGFVWLKRVWVALVLTPGKKGSFLLSKRNVTAKVGNNFFDHDKY